MILLVSGGEDYFFRLVEFCDLTAVVVLSNAKMSLKTCGIESF